VDPSDSSGNTAYVGGVDLWETGDGGVTWNNVTDAYAGGLAHPDQHALAFFSSSSSSYYLGNDGGVWSRAVGNGFTDLNGGGLNITQFYGGGIGDVGPDATLYGGAQDNGESQYPLEHFTDTEQWNEVYGGDAGNTLVDYTNNATIYEESDSVGVKNVQVISKSTDGEQRWNTVMNGINLQDNVNFVMPLIMSPGSNTELLAGTDHVYRTTDGGSSWTAISGVLNPYACQNFTNTCPLSALAVAPSTDQTIYAGDDAGNVYVTTTGGCPNRSCWSSGVTVGGPQGSIVTGLAVAPNNSQLVYASFNGFVPAEAQNPNCNNQPAGEHIFKSTDGGTTWQDISCSLPNIPFVSILVNRLDGSLIAGSDTGVYSSTDQGNTWSHTGPACPISRSIRSSPTTIAPSSMSPPMAGGCGPFRYN